MQDAQKNDGVDGNKNAGQQATVWNEVAKP
jgi:hypothetical protein